MESSSNNSLSRFFYHWARICYDNAKITVAISFLIILGVGSQAAKIKMDISTEAMLRADDPVRLNYQEFRKTFGREDVIVISIPTGGSINKELLADVYRLQNEIEDQVPYVSKITSLLNARYTYGETSEYGEEDELIVEDLLEGYPDYKWSDEELNAYVLSQPAYVNRIISEDGKYLALVVELQTYSQNSAQDGSNELLNETHSAQTFEALRALVDSHTELDIAMSGEPVLLTVTNSLTAKDTTRTGITALIMAIIFMVFFFRRLSGVLIPFVVINGSILGTVGLMGFFGSPFTMTSSAVVVLILGIGTADVVHILSLFYKKYDQEGDKREAMLYAMSHSAPAVFLTTVTTMIGFLSFVVGDLASTAELGIYAALMVIFALFYTVTLGPSLISMFKIKRKENTRSDNKRLIAFLSACGEFGMRYPRSISLLSIAAFLVGLWGTSFLNMSFDPISAFPDSLVEKQDNYTIDQQYDGITNFEIVIDSGKQTGIYEADFVVKLIQAEERLSYTQFYGADFGDTYSVLDIVREVNKSLNGNDPEFYQIPEDRELLAQEVLLFELSQADDLFDVIDNNKQKARITLKTAHADGVEYEFMIREIEGELRSIFGEETPIVITGVSALVAESVPKAIRTMSKSYVIAGVLIIFILMILVGSFKIGMISIIPNLLPIVATMNIMVWLNWPLDMSTIMVGAIAMGLVVDDSLHFLYHVKNHFKDNGNMSWSIRETLTSIGPALVITTAIFSSCMLVDLTSTIFSVFVFGTSMAMIAVFALLSDIIIAPALLVWVYGKEDEK